jgi:hypothetical protein
MPLCQIELKIDAKSSILKELEVDKTYVGAKSKYKKVDLIDPAKDQAYQAFFKNLPEGYAEVVDVQLRPIPRGGGYDVYLVRNDGGGGQNYASTHVGIVH